MQSESVYKSWREVYDDPTLLLLDPYTLPSVRSGKTKLQVPQPLDLTSIELQPQLQLSPPGTEPDLNTDLFNHELYNQVQGYQELYQLQAYQRLQTLLNPGAGIGDSIFANHSGVILANIDAIFNLTKADGGYLLPRGGQDLIYTSLGSDATNQETYSGGMVQYLQYRLPRAFGYGLSPTKEAGGAPWIKSRLDLTRFQITNGLQGSGDVVDNSDWFSQWLQSKDVTISSTIPAQKLKEDGLGLDLLLANDFNQALAENIPAKYQHSIMARLVAQAQVGLQDLWPGGQLVMLYPEVSTSARADLLLLLASLFNQAYLFKPFSADPRDPSFYLVAQGYQPGARSQEVQQILAEAHQAQQRGQVLTGMLKTRPPAILKQLRTKTDQHLNRQKLVGQLAQRAVAGIGPEELRGLVPQYENYYATAYWNLMSKNPGSK